MRELDQKKDYSRIEGSQPGQRFIQDGAYFGTDMKYTSELDGEVLDLHLIEPDLTPLDEPLNLFDILQGVTVDIVAMLDTLSADTLEDLLALERRGAARKRIIKSILNELKLHTE